MRTKSTSTKLRSGEMSMIRFAFLWVLATNISAVKSINLQRLQKPQQRWQQNHRKQDELHPESLIVTSTTIDAVGIAMKVNRKSSSTDSVDIIKTIPCIEKEYDHEDNFSTHPLSRNFQRIINNCGTYSSQNSDKTYDFDGMSSLLMLEIQDAIRFIEDNGYVVADNCSKRSQTFKCVEEYNTTTKDTILSRTKTTVVPKRIRRRLSHKEKFIRRYHHHKTHPKLVPKPLFTDISNDTTTSMTNVTASTFADSNGTSDASTLFASDNNESATSLDDDGFDDEYFIEDEDPWYVTINLLGTLVCVLVAAIAAGLTLGLLGLDPLMLLIKERAAVDMNERMMASKLLPVIKRHHLLLVSLLLMNSIANESLPIFLEKLVPPTVAVILSVTLVLFFGEIIPSAIFTGPNQLKIAYNLVPLVKVVMTILYPIAGPIAMILDYLLGGGSSSKGDHNRTSSKEVTTQLLQGFSKHNHLGVGDMSKADDYHNSPDHDDELISTYDRGELAALIRIQYELFSGKNKKRKDRKLVTKPFGDRSILQEDYSATIHQTKRLFERGVSLNSDELRQVVQYYQNSNRPNDALQNKDNDKDNNNATFHQKLDSNGDINTIISDNSNPLDTSRLSRSIARTRDHNRDSSIVIDEVMMVEGALQMRTKVAFDVFTALRNVYAIPNTMILNERNMVEIYASGYTRIPVYDEEVGKTRKNPKSAIIGILVTKLLIVVNPKDKRTVGSLPLRKPQCVSPATPLVDLINMFQTGGSRGAHQALVCTVPSAGNRALQYEGTYLPEKAGLIGIITMEDALEILLQEQIYDEMDKEQRAGHRLAEMIMRRWKIYSKKRKHEREKQLEEQQRQQQLQQDELEREKALKETDRPLLSSLFFPRRNSSFTTRSTSSAPPGEGTALLDQRTR